MLQEPKRLLCLSCAGGRAYCRESHHWPGCQGAPAWGRCGTARGGGEVGAGCALHSTLRLCPDGSQLSRHDSVPGPPHCLCLCLGGPSILPPRGSSSLSSHPCCGDAAWGLTSWNQVCPPSHFCCMISGKRSDLSEPQFLPLHNGSSNSASVTELLGRLHD